MSEIRPLRREDVPAVAGLYREVERTDWRIPPEELEAWFERTLFDQPWADPDVPSLVYVDDDDRIAAFLASHARRLRLDGRDLRMGASGPLVAHPRVRNRAAGALLLRSYLAGPQELSITDGATEEVRELFELSGGQMLHVSCVGWARVFRPWSFAGDRALAARPRLRGPARARARPLWSVLDAVTPRAVRPLAAAPPPETHSEELTPHAVLEHLDDVTRGLRLVPAYDEAFLAWAFEEAARVHTLGRPVRRLVRDARGRVLGWYVYFIAPGRESQVLHVAARARDAGAVLDDLFADAQARRAAALVGRVEPRLLAPLGHRHALFRYNPRSLIHSRDPEVLGALTSGSALLTRLEAEWWLAR